tara:strand:+ start:232 stop:342 length:111 start_codon:yes stop_codon:yes gene_type:complete
MVGEIMVGETTVGKTTVHTTFPKPAAAPVASRAASH